MGPLGRIRSKQQQQPPLPQQPMQRQQSPRHDEYEQYGMNYRTTSGTSNLVRNNTNDNMSYITDVSSVTCTTALGPSYSHESEEGDGDTSYFSMTEVNSSLTGWTGADQRSIPTAMMMSQKASQKDAYENKKKLPPISEPKSSADELSVVMDSSGDDGSVEASLITGKLKSMNADNWNPRPMCVDAGKGNHGKAPSQRPPASPRPPRSPSPKTIVQPGNKPSQFRSPSPSNANKSSQEKGFFKETIEPPKSKEQVNSDTPKTEPPSPKSVLKSKVPSSPTSKKRQPVPPLKNSEDDEEETWEQDCNYDINPTIMFQMLENGDWRETIDFLDGKSSNLDLWNLIQKVGGGQKKLDVNEMQARQKELRSQARTWIVRRDLKTGVLRWRMLPLHASLVFNAPFDVVLRLYHLYPGSIRCRNDLGMLPLHHVFMYGNEDRILEMFLDVFPEALSVVDDKGRLPLGCTPQDGSDNERRSNILDLYAKFQVEVTTRLLEEARKAKEESAAKKEVAKGKVQAQENAPMAAAPRPGFVQQYGQQAKTQQQQPLQPLQPKANIPPPPNQRPQAKTQQHQTVQQKSNMPPPAPQTIQSPESVASLGIAPRYSPAPGFNQMPYEAMRAASTKPQDAANKATHQDIDDEKSLTNEDRYATSDESVSENTNTLNLANIQSERELLRNDLLKLGGLDPIKEDAPEEKVGGGGGVKKIKKGWRKLFKKGGAQASI